MINVAMVSRGHRFKFVALIGFLEILQRAVEEQVADKKRRQEAERERKEREAAAEERRLEEERAKMRRQYEEEQEKARKKEVSWVTYADLLWQENPVVLNRSFLNENMWIRVQHNINFIENPVVIGVSWMKTFVLGSSTTFIDSAEQNTEQDQSDRYSKSSFCRKRLKERAWSLKEQACLPDEKTIIFNLWWCQWGVAEMLCVYHVPVTFFLARCNRRRFSPSFGPLTHQKKSTSVNDNNVPIFQVWSYLIGWD